MFIIYSKDEEGYYLTGICEIVLPYCDICWMLIPGTLNLSE
jgi:hypothetical protein